MYMFQAGDWKILAPEMSTHPRLKDLRILSSQIMLPLEKSHPYIISNQCFNISFLNIYQCTNSYHQTSEYYSNIKENNVNQEKQQFGANNNERSIRKSDKALKLSEIGRHYIILRE